MEKDNNHIDDLIGKYLAGEAAPDESRLVESWITQNDQNQRYFDHMKVIFDRAASITEVQQFDTDAAWNKLKTKLRHENGAKVVQLDTTPRNLNFLLRIAASIILVAAVGYLVFRWSSPQTQAIEVVAQEKVKTDTLPDGTQVVLNKQTQLAYEFDRKSEKHVVKLKGEAYFNIHQKEDKEEFIVQAEEVFVRDIGTSFNVTAYPGANTIEVTVDEGEVRFFTSEDNGINVKAKGKGVYNKLTKTFSVAQPDVNETAYRTKFFSFNDSDLKTIVERLNQVYAERFRINDEIKDCRLTVTFSNEEAKEIANVIAETLGLRVTVNGNEILLEGSGCGD